MSGTGKYWSAKEHGLEVTAQGQLVGSGNQKSQISNLKPAAEFTDADRMFFGQYKDRPLGEVPMKYWRWLMEKPGFMERNPRLADYIRRRFGIPQKPTEGTK
jgi:hypothetical protein